jgi:hypothetical protein
MAGVGGMLADKAKAGMEGKGMVVTIWETTKKALERISQMSPEMAPFVARAMAVMDSGFEKLGQGKGGVQTENPNETKPAESSAPGGVGPGQGFPG